MKSRNLGTLLLAFLSLGGIQSLPGLAGEEPGETPNLQRPRITQSQIAGGNQKLGNPSLKPAQVGRNIKDNRMGTNKCGPGITSV